MSRDKAFNSACLEEGTFGLEVYIDKGARTTVEAHQGELARDGEDGGRTFMPRRTRLVPDDFVNAGFTDGCRGCAWLQDRVGGRQGLSEECRNRVEEHLKQSEGGNERLQRAQGRIENWCSEEVRKSDTVRVPQSDVTADKMDEQVVDMEEAPVRQTSQNDVGADRISEIYDIFFRN